MSNRRSSSRADGEDASRRSAWPWLLAAGPVLVVVASLSTAWLAASRNDTVVADDYYKLGLTINRRLAATPVLPAVPRATIAIGADGEVRVRLAPPVDSPPLPLPAHLRLTVLRPGERAAAGALVLERGETDEFVGVLSDVGAGRRIVTLESDAWRLPVTVVERLPATITLGEARTS
jgi:uncharacterized protein